MVQRLLLSLVLVAAGFAGGLVVTSRMHSAAYSRAETGPAGPSLAAAPAPAAASVGGPDFTRVAGQAVKGVANISSLQVTRTSNSPFAGDPFFRYFFGNDDDFFGSRDRRSLSLGSGVIISSNGYVVTNSHVIGDHVRQITLSLPDQREIQGKVIGTDAATDIALLKVGLTELPVVPWGDSSQLQVGEWVLAIGSPFQLSRTVTAGIVSATGRANVGFAEYEDFIQTDAAINPGNSGGALINVKGELVGINTGIFSQSGGYQGVGFAVPSNLARRIVDDLRQYGGVRRGSIGYLQVEKLTGQTAREVGVRTTEGALISRMARSSEAFDAGLRPGDVIVGFNGLPVNDSSQFIRMVSDSKIGSTVTLQVMRRGRSMEFRLPIVSRATSRRGVTR